MKLICLNTGGGVFRKELRDFIAQYAADIDIFCFQEMFNDAADAHSKLNSIDVNLYKTLTGLLPSHKGYYAPSQDNDEGLAIFVKSHITIDKHDSEFVHRSRNAMEGEDRKTLGRNLQYVRFAVNGQDYTIVNFHGLWNSAGKTDTPDRIKQSNRIKKFIDKNAVGKVILVGDFNLSPHTKSMVILDKDMRNLIKEFGVTSTRSCHYKWPNKFADYVLVSKNLHVINFEVLPWVVSDHLPLYLEFR